MKLSDFRNIDRNNIASWPQGVKITACVLLFGLLLLAGWWYSIKEQQETLEQKQGEETRLKADFHSKQEKVVNLERLKQQLEDMCERLDQLKRELPSKTEMPKLLIDISQSALTAGLESQLFKPGPETVQQGFYAEKPIQLRMVGTYHQFGSFISAVAALERVVILTMHDVSLKPTDVRAAGQLTLEGTVKTYHYVDEGEAGAKGAEKCLGGSEPAKPGAPASPAPAKPAAKGDA
jgi:type IV pilus assembly protein PilO